MTDNQADRVLGAIYTLTFSALVIELCHSHNGLRAFAAAAVVGTASAAVSRLFDAAAQNLTRGSVIYGPKPGPHRPQTAVPAPQPHAAPLRLK